MHLTLVSAPDSEPVTVADVRDRLAISSDEMSDPAVKALILAATEKLDGAMGWLGRALIKQTWRLIRSGFSPAIRIPLPPLIGVVSVKYMDGEGVMQTLDPSAYSIVGGYPTTIRAVSGWPPAAVRGDAVQVEFEAGYGAAATDVPEPIRTAIVLEVAHLRSMMQRNLFISEEVVEGVGSQRFVVGGSAGAAVSMAVANLLAPYRVISL